MNNASNETTPQTGNRFAFGCLGAIVIHPLLFLLVFLKGFVFGSSQELVMSATGGSGPTKYLLEGGLNAMGNLAIYYIFLGFIIFPIVSVVGSVISILIGKQWSQASGIIDGLKSSTRPQTASTSLVQLVGIWASSLIIGQSSVQYLILSSETIHWGNLSTILTGLYLCIWILGAAAAFIKHHDLRVSACLIGIAVLLPILGPFLPRFILLAVVIGFLLFCISQRMFASSHGNSDDMRVNFSTHESELSGFALFALAGVTFYTFVCLFCVFWALSLASGSENWGPGMVMILGAWGIPVFGGISPLLRKWAGHWRWLTTQSLWIAVACEICLCALAWLGVIFHR